MTTYNNAIKEYESGNEDKHKLIYAYFGLAVYYSQCLEEAFSKMIWSNRIIKNKVKTNKEVNDIIDAIENSRKTMGNFINEVKHAYSLSEDIKEDLTTILNKRNYLVHKYFKLEIQKFYSDLGRREILQYLCNFIDESKELENKLESYYISYTKKIGLTEERIKQIMAEIIDEERKRVNS